MIEKRLHFAWITQWGKITQQNFRVCVHYAGKWSKTLMFTEWNTVCFEGHAVKHWNSVNHAVIFFTRSLNIYSDSIIQSLYVFSCVVFEKVGVDVRADCIVGTCYNGQTACMIPLALSKLGENPETVSVYIVSMHLLRSKQNKKKKKKEKKKKQMYY